MSDDALSFAGQKDVPARIYRVVVGGTPQTAQAVDVPPDTVKYTVLVWTQQMKGYLENLEPVNRVTRNVNINSAAVGTPCRVILTVGQPPRLYLHEEEIPYTICNPDPPPSPFADVLR